MKEIRNAINSSDDKDQLERELAGALDMPISLLKDQMSRLSLKQTPFKVFDPASTEQLDGLWENCLKIDKDLNVYLFYVQSEFKSYFKKGF